MRFLLFDKVTSLEVGKRITCVKCFSMQDEHLREHYPKRPLVPGALLVESMLQALGWLVIRTVEFKQLPLFSMLEDCVLPPDLEPGVRLDVSGELLSINPKGSMGRAEVRLDGKVVASLGRVLFAHFAPRSPDEIRGWFGVYARLA